MYACSPLRVLPFTRTSQHANLLSRLLGNLRSRLVGLLLLNEPRLAERCNTYHSRKSLLVVLLTYH
jgi:hypothetical protein